jgi:3',5'-cyclic AMP phosphodiesterase CpdA
MEKTLVWLHLSDVHLCRPRTDWDANRMLRALREDLEVVQRDHGLHPDLVFFTGDAAFGHLGEAEGLSISSQFGEAFRLFEGVRRAFKPAVRRESFFIVPGNHDVNRKRVLSSHTEWLDNPRRGREEIDNCIREANDQWREFMKRLADYSDFLKAAGYGHVIQDPDRLVYTAIRRIHGIRVGVAGFNTAWSCARDGEKGQLWSGGHWQLEHLHAALLSKKAKLRIALMHHPVNWLREQEDPSIGREIERDFQFSLHGHEHQDWILPIGDSHVRIAAGACYDRSDKPSGYNFVRLDLRSGALEVWLREYDRAGAKWKARVIPDRTDPFGVWRPTFRLPPDAVADGPPASPPPGVREPEVGSGRGAGRRGRPEPEPRPDTDAEAGGTAERPSRAGDDSLRIQCAHHAMFGDVIFPTGDFVLREVIEGFQWQGASPARTVPLLSFASRISPEGDVQVRSLTLPYTVRVDQRRPVQLAETREGPISAYPVHFDPPLVAGHNPLTLICQRIWHGVMYSSVEDKRQHHLGEEWEPWDHYLKQIRWPCDHLSIHLRFWPPDWQAREMRAVVLDADESEVQAEPHQLTCVWPAGQVRAPGVPYIPSSEGSVRVAGPRPRFYYGLRWGLPDSGPLPTPQGVKRLRDRFVRLSAYPKAAQIVKRFLRDVVVSTAGLIEALQAASPGGGEDIHAYFFSYDPSKGTLICQDTTAPEDDYLRNLQVRWGQDLIGTACRRRRAAFYSAGRPQVRDFPVSSDEFLRRVRALLAFPIIPEEEWVVGVVAVASCNATDTPAPGGDEGLAAIAGDERRCQTWTEEVFQLWNHHGPAS